ncbi:MAG: hypothetical protein IPH07_21055 [Deltaproteobacteria bacterium]|nr:hypothetical protein [Deltaproteobacteria bacterium]MBK8239819.1 hypothetical protein [Deltaproteobacteria bacterium]MBK8716205.1 hypothetical protein [Deltaproteobacteria bacterium]MBP7289434.1 hypothetical protein [Nannocystaceae bacterium]
MPRRETSSARIATPPNREGHGRQVDDLAAVLARHGALPWSLCKGMMLRLVAAIAQAREAGVAPRRLSLETCLRPRFSRDHVDVKLQGPFVRAELRATDEDARDLARILHALLDQDCGTVPPGLDNVLMRALGTIGYADAQEFARALVAIDRPRGMIASEGQAQAQVAGAFELDPEVEAAKDAEMSRLRSLPPRGATLRAVELTPTPQA